MKFDDLLENYIILKDNNREFYYDIKDNIDNYSEFINEILSYDVIIKDDFIKLEKIPVIPESWMGITDFKNKKEYIFFMLLLMFLEEKNKEDQFILSNITEYIVNYYPDEKIEWTNFTNRKSLINVLKFSLKIGIMRKNDGEEEDFSRSEYAEVLYESTGISRYIVRRFNYSIEDVEDYRDLINNVWDGISEDKGSVRKSRAFRRLTLSPIVYKDDGNESDYDYIKKNRSYIANIFEKYLGWTVHFHKNAALAVLESQSTLRDTFPNQKGEASITLFVNREILKRVQEGTLKPKENDMIILDESEFDNILIKVREEEGHGFAKIYREASTERYILDIKKYMASFSFIKREEGIIKLMPLIGKIIGEYPKDYKGVER